MAASALLRELLDASPYEWQRVAACRGRWDEFDGIKQETTRVCFTECPVRAQCLKEAMEYEEREAMEGEISWDGRRVYRSQTGNYRTGIRGGYTPAERQYIAFALELDASLTEF